MKLKLRCLVTAVAAGAIAAPALAQDGGLARKAMLGVAIEGAVGGAKIVSFWLTRRNS